MNIIAVDITNLGILLCYLHKSSAKLLKLEKGESNTSPAIEGSLSACISAVTAPMLLPHSPIVEVLPDFLKCSTTTEISSLSYHPKDMYSPSDCPHPI